LSCNACGGGDDDEGRVRDRACQLDEKNGSYNYLLGEAYWTVGELERAEEYYTKAIAIKANDAGSVGIMPCCLWSPSS
jgi:tetratricopeptide (TPR) repeat protein